MRRSFMFHKTDVNFCLLLHFYRFPHKNCLSANRKSFAIQSHNSNIFFLQVKSSHVRLHIDFPSPASHVMSYANSRIYLKWYIALNTFQFPPDIVRLVDLHLQNAEGRTHQIIINCKRAWSFGLEKFQWKLRVKNFNVITEQLTHNQSKISLRKSVAGAAQSAKLILFAFETIRLIKNVLSQAKAA